MQGNSGWPILQASKCIRFMGEVFDIYTSSHPHPLSSSSFLGKYLVISTISLRFGHIAPMDHSPILPMDNLTALPISTSGIGAPQAFGAHYFAAEVPKKIPAYRGKAITEADWPTLKPIIYRLYISEKLTFPKVKEALNVELGKRQFTRKIEEWGFRKNFRKDEREEIVKGGNIPQRFIHDSRINQKRVDRLQRRNGARMSVGSENHSSGMLSTQDRTLPKTTKIAEEDPGSHDTITEEIPTSNSPGDTIITGAMVPWTSNQAADNSSRLSRLTESSTQLEIKKTITTTSFDNGDENVEERQDICGRKTIYAWNGVEGASKTIWQHFSMRRTVSRSTKWSLSKRFLYQDHTTGT
ncbi:hypothetical protein OCU04_011903 [Sclerotinia nivalis]|uniref:Clr5 domain-containing protein n=1 Tax=Sclerotinia nivalis TaxID=352851 RepID=A0A9X0ADN7_9HELO|nr:hypothetical protein OCU04_011903 [Sclerotinia nivalis]